MDAKAIIERLKTALEAKTDGDLAAKIDVPVETINSWKRRNSIPIDSILKIAERENISLDWLVLGHGQQESKGVGGSRLKIQVREGVAALRCALSTIQMNENQIQEIVALWLHWRAIISVTRGKVVAEHGLTDDEAIGLFLKKWEENLAADSLGSVKLDS